MNTTAPEPSRGIARRRRRIVMIAGIALPGAVVLGLIAMLVTWWTIGRDDPSQFEGRVAEIEQRYTDGFPQGEVLLVGSSTFEYWETAAADLAPLRTENVGIRQTKVGDQLAYLDRLVEPFKPSTIVVYTGSNDINGLPIYSKTGERTADLIIQYVHALRDALPEARIYVVGIVETPAREGVRADVQEANVILAEHAGASDSFTFVDTTSLLRTDGTIDGTLFRDDALHFNERGYDAFAAIVREALSVEQ